MFGHIPRWRHVLVVLVLAAVGLLAAFGGIGDDRPERFDAKQIVITPVGIDGLRIREVVDEDFGSSARHGYERAIPVDFGVPTDVVASSPDAPDQVSVRNGTFETLIRIGDPDRTVSGQHRYVLEYTLASARLSSGQLALDIIGNDETLATDRFEIIVTGLVLDRATCSMGAFAARGGCALNRDGETYRAVIEPLHPSEGITIGGSIVGRTSVTTIEPPPLPQRRGDHRLLLAAGIVVLGGIASVATMLLTRRLGRNEVYRGGAVAAAFGAPGAPGAPGRPFAPGADAADIELVPDDRLDDFATIEFVPPRGLQPWQGAAVLLERLDDDTVGAWFSGLAAREAITLEQRDGSLVLAPGPKRNELDPADDALIAQMLASRDEVKLGSYDAAFATVWAAVGKQQEQFLAATRWWKRQPPRKGGGSGIGAALILTVVVVVWVGGATVIARALDLLRTWPSALGFGVIVPTLMAAYLYRALLPVRTAPGSALAIQTESFRRFLAASEGRHVDWAWQQGLLREYSAWAVALGAAEAWGRALASSHVPPTETHVSSPLLISSMHHSLSTARQAPSSSSSGGSGHSFGGFSGGSVGGGGGGGHSGSW